MSTRYSRRRFLATSLIGAGGFWIGSSAGLAKPRKLSANEKLNIGVIGVANRGGEDLAGVASQNIVALCDVDDKYLAGGAKKFPNAKTYSDFRKLLDQDGIDAVVIATPDHTHAVATTMALKSGRHVYCEKPLTHTISECRRVRELAKKEKLVTKLPCTGLPDISPCRLQGSTQREHEQ